MRDHFTVGIFILIMIGATHGLEKITQAGKGTDFANIRDEIKERRERQPIKGPEAFDREGK